MMNVIEKVEFPHERMGLVTTVTLKYGKKADSDWTSLSLGTASESKFLSRISSHSMIDWNQVETIVNGERSEGVQGNVWVVTVLSEDKCRQSFAGLLPPSFNEDELVSYFD